MKHWVSVLLIMLSLALVLVACGGDDAPAPTAAPQAAAPTPVEVAAEAPAPAGDPETGKQIFSTTCAACHGPAGEGVQGLGKDMTKSEFIAGLSDEELIAFVKVGRRIDDPLNTTGVDMPPKGGNPALSDEKLVDIVAFIRSIHTN